MFLQTTLHSTYIIDILPRLKPWDSLTSSGSIIQSYRLNYSHCVQDTEARLSKIAMEMLADINKDTVNFSPNFDETEKEPDVLPCRFPNLLCNGTTGIAVGMASNIPPHNIKETIDAVVKMINNRIDENRDTEIEELMSVIQGPDFPTGATIIGRRGIEEAYRTGKGKIIVRAVTNIEPMQNGKNRIVVTELPYGVNKAKLIEKIAELVKDKRVDGITDLADQSSREGMRISIELRRDVNPNVVLNQLMKHTQLQDTFGVIMLALVGGEPRILNIHDMLYYYLQHQEEVVTRRTRYDLSKAQERAHILEGLLIALDHIDRVIEIIRGSANVVAAKASLIEEFGLSDAQSQAIVDMRLRALTGLERNRLENEYKELEERIAYLQSILGDEKVLLGVIRDELLTIKAKYGDDRKTAIELAEDEFNAEDLIPNEAAVIAMTKLDYIKRMSPDHFKAQNRGGKGIKGMNILDEDYIADLITINNHDYVLFFTNLGRVYQLKGYEIPEASRTARGTAVINLLQLQAGEKVTSILRNEGHESGYLTMATKLGMIKRTNLSEYGNIRKVGLAAISLREGDELIDVHVTDGKRDIIMISHLGQCIRFDENDARATGRVSMGVKGMNLADGDSVIGMQVADENGELLFVSEMGMGKKTAMSEFKDQNRGGKGIRCYRVNAKTGNLAGVKVYKEGHELMLITTEGTVIRMKTDTIPVLGRDTSGVKLMQVDQENVKVSSIELIEESKEEEFTETSEETVDSEEV